MLWAQTAHATAIFSGRAGGVSTGAYASLNLGPWHGDDPSSVAANHAAVRALASADRPRELLLGRQVHESSVAAHLADGAAVDPNGVDGHVTDREDLAVAVLTADCLPVALLAPWGVGVAHAGWRGLAAGILGGTIGELLALGGPEADTAQICAAIGPCAGPCCYEVGEEVHAAFAGWPGHDPAARTLDLPGLAEAALRHEGIVDLAHAGRCTMCGPGYFSHRASGGTTGRQAGVAWRS